MTEVQWLAAGALLIPRKRGLVKDQVRSRNPMVGMHHASNRCSGSGTGYSGNRNYTPSQHSNNPGAELALSPAGGRQEWASAAARGTKVTRATAEEVAAAAAVAAAEGEAEGAPALEASPRVSTGRGGKSYHASHSDLAPLFFPCLICPYFFLQCLSFIKNCFWIQQYSSQFYYIFAQLSPIQ